MPGEKLNSPNRSTFMALRLNRRCYPNDFIMGCFAVLATWSCLGEDARPVLLLSGIFAIAGFRIFSIDSIWRRRSAPLPEPGQLGFKPYSKSLVF